MVRCGYLRVYRENVRKSVICEVVAVGARFRLSSISPDCYSAA